MKGVQISFRDIMSGKEYNNIFAGSGESLLFKGLKKVTLKSINEVLLGYKSELKNSSLSIFLEKLDLQRKERIKLSKKYESQIKEMLVQILNNKKLKNSICSKVDYSKLLNKYKINSLDDFEYILNNHDDFNDELNRVVHKIIIEELSLAIKQSNYYKDCMRYQNVAIQRFKSYIWGLLKYIGGKLSWNDIVKIGTWIVDTIEELTTKCRVGKTYSFCFAKK